MVHLVMSERLFDESSVRIANLSKIVEIIWVAFESLNKIARIAKWLI